MKFAHPAMELAEVCLRILDPSHQFVRDMRRRRTQMLPGIKAGEVESFPRAGSRPAAAFWASSTPRRCVAATKAICSLASPAKSDALRLGGVVAGLGLDIGLPPIVKW